MRMRLPMGLTALFLLTGLLSCTPPPAEETVDIEQVKSEVVALEKAFEDAENAGDVEGILAFYADDAHSMPPNEATRKGKDAIRKSLQENVDPESGNTVKFATIDVWAAGNMAVETGTYTSKDAEGNVVAKGKYMCLFEKRDGKYVAVRDIWNSDMKEEDEDDDSMEEADMEG